jgi:hypothetical protein
MNGNIIGEEFEDYVFEQIAQRQKDQYSGYTSLRTPQQLQYLNNQNAWVKLASGASINKADGGLERIKKIVKDDTLVDQFAGDELAKKTILFNGLSEVTPATYNEGKKVEELAEYNLRSGYSKTSSIWNLTSAYGLGGSEFGQQPMPGIQSVSVKSLNRGSIREANVKIKAYNKFQFEIIELLYLRIGFTMMLEWGNDKFINNKGEYQQTGNTIIEDLWFSSTGYTQLTMIDAIERYRGTYSGNYDGFFGKVVNFTWTFGPDGNYDIDLKLITVGDVVESLQANLPVNSSEVGLINVELTSSINEKGAYLNLSDSSIVNAAQNNKIGKYLFKSIADESLWDGSNKEYFSLKSTQDSSTNSKGRITSDFPLDKKINDKYNYFMTFGELLNIFQNNLIPGIELAGKINPCLDIENDPLTNKISYYPNQTSLDPRVCIFRYVFGSLGESNPKYSISGINIPGYLYNLNNYVDVIDSNVLYGKLMNIYLNYDFISKCLVSNTKDGKLSVFKFFQKICDGINSALGGVNNIEPIIKNDKIVTFVDQNPIPGYLETLSVDKTIVDLEVYGYNEASGSANFVQDISFKTEITPDLASMMTIGTTAGGSNEDGTAFSYWNKGLKDRYAPKYTEPQGDIKTSERPNKDRVLELIKIFDDKSSWVLFSKKDPFISQSTIEGVNVYKKSKYTNKRRNIEYGTVFGVMSAAEFCKAVIKEDQYIKNNPDIISQSELANEKGNNYAVYLAEAFGGTTGVVVRTVKGRGNSKKVVETTLTPIPIKKSKYTLFDTKFIGRAKTTYRSYINAISKANFFDKEDEEEITPSNTIGFIPVGFNIKLQGIAGVKIYNKLNINNTFLPSQYPTALKFVIKGVNHSISNNKWETSLDTISIPKVKNTIKGDMNEFLNNLSTSLIPDLLPEENRGPLPHTGDRITRIYYKGKEIKRFDLTKLMNKEAQPTFEAFLTEFVNKWDGYKMHVNAIGRTFEKSIQLKAEDSSNASPGYSKHNYYAGLDFNIETPTGDWLRKQGMRYKWINQGFQKLANKHGIEWGGDFSSYEDCIHFSYIFNINTAVKNAVAKYGSLENLKSDEGKTIKLT